MSLSKGEMEKLRTAHRMVSATDPLFWEKVGRRVGRSAEECQESWFSRFTGEKQDLAKQEEKRRAAMVERRVDRARTAIAEATKVAEVGADTSFADAHAAKRAREKLRKALKELQKVNHSFPKVSKRYSYDLDESVFATVPSPPRKEASIALSSSSSSSVSSSSSESEEEEEGNKREDWRPAAGYLEALRRKQHSTKTAAALAPKKKIDINDGLEARQLRSLDAKIAKQHEEIHFLSDDHLEEREDQHDDGRSHLLPVV